MTTRRPLMLTILLLALLATLPDARAFHHPRLGRFMQRDPLGYVDGMGLYSYIDRSPADRVDPFGMKQKKPKNPQEVEIWRRRNEKTFAKLFSKRRPDPQSVFEEAGNLQISIKSCNVVILFGHTSVFYFSHVTIKGHSAVGYLSCFADIFNKEINQDTFYSYVTPDPRDGEGEGILVDNKFYYPGDESNRIPGFPTIRGPIGPADGEKIRYSIPAYLRLLQPELIEMYKLSVGPKDKDGFITDFSTWNGGYGKGPDAFKSLVSDATDKARKEGKRLAKDCKCKCDFIDVWFVHVGSGSRVTQRYQGILDTYMCRKNSKKENLPTKDKQIERAEEQRKNRLKRRYQ